ncbi:MAG TPA: glutathione S-transferase family protein [Alphaproteobacteria bacterium]|nr:glutathione S-transferase family protein [Alphaproteobacteria bacterium]
MRLYYAETLNPRKACAVARHLGSPVEFVRVDLAKGEQRTPAFTAMNPNQKVPVLEVGGRTIWESTAIMVFLAREAGSDLWPRDERQVEVMRWLAWDLQHFSRHGASLYFQNIIKPRFFKAPPDAAAVEEATGFFRTYARVLDDHLRGRDWLVGGGLTLADFAVAVTLPYAEEGRIPVAEFPEIRRWHARLEALPAWREPFPAAKAAA